MIISVLNIKGGVDKTTVATNLAVGIAKSGKSGIIQKQSNIKDLF